MLRSIFISGFTGYLVFALFYALLQLVRGMEPMLSWLGLALAAGAVPKPEAGGVLFFGSFPRAA